MSLNNPDSRRALRSIVQAVVALAVIGLAFWLTHLLRDDIPGLREIARYSLGIIAMGTFLYGAENVRRVSFEAGIIKAKIGEQGDKPDA